MNEYDRNKDGKIQGIHLLDVYIHVYIKLYQLIERDILIELLPLSKL